MLKWDSFLCVDMCGEKVLLIDKLFNEIKRILKFIDF